MTRVSTDMAAPATAPPTGRAAERRALTVMGLVQGVGFRPFVYRLATELGLAGLIRNTGEGVQIEVEGAPTSIARFVQRIRAEPPPHAVIRRVDTLSREPSGQQGFSIEPSSGPGMGAGQVPPDLAPCPDCSLEVADPSNRRFRYPFTTCTRCGPRFTIIQSMPFDRANTTMSRFALCESCRHEYDDPRDRRFHAESIACPTCGPRLELWDPSGGVVATEDVALRETARAIRRGQIVAIKGVGGFQFLVDATNDTAVRELRRRKHRPDKPFALLAGSLEDVRTLCRVSEPEAALLGSSRAPIVLLRARRAVVAPSVAPNNPNLGVMLPASVLHTLLSRDLQAPVVATSGNLADEPICTSEHEALGRFCGIADLLLVHDRPIANHADDSVVRVIDDRAVVLRVGRGYAPLVVPDPRGGAAVRAFGNGQKNTVAVTTPAGIVVSQHIGSLGSAASRETMRRTVANLARLHGVRPSATIGDLHPDDAAAGEARALGGPWRAVQHHHAHVASCMAEHGADGPVLGVAWDGTGYGSDGTIWGGEFLVVDGATWRRVGHLRQFRLAGGERAVREPRRAAIGALFELFGEAALAQTDLAPVATLAKSERSIIAGMLGRRINSPLTSSAGRLFDAVSALLGICQVATFEGQAAMALEFAAEDDAELADFSPRGMGRYPIDVIAQDGVWVVDWGPAVIALIHDARRGTPVSMMARAFHHALADAIVGLAHRVGQERVVLTGGCFQNRVLSEQARRRLKAEGFEALCHGLVPPNDGGLCVGQAYAAR